MHEQLAAGYDSLSDREMQLLRLAAQGLTDNAISHKLGISLPTVSTYWGRIRGKVGSANRTELVASYLKEKAHGVIEALRQENQRLVSELKSSSESVGELVAMADAYREVLEMSHDAVIMVQERGTVVLSNETANEMFGYTKLEGHHIEDLLPSRYRTRHAKNRTDFHASPTRRNMGEHLATFGLRKDGSEFPIGVILSANQTPHGLIVTSIVRDITAEFAKELRQKA